MAKIPFNLLSFKFQKRYKNSGFKKDKHIIEDKLNNGLDTETYQGYCKLICDDMGNYQICENIYDILSFLTSARFRNKYNWFFNIKFDFEAIIKHLSYSQLIDLYNDKLLKIEGGGETSDGRIIKRDFIIKYIDKKYFSIQDYSFSKGGGNYYYFYDMRNFLDTSLNKAAKKFLNDVKLDTVNTEKLNTDILYWEANKSLIIQYCIKDALLTKQLADFFWSIVYEKLNYYPKQPMSKGKLSEEYFLHYCKIPTINGIPLKVLEYAYESFYGGHFEILKRGYFPVVNSYDIKSAYPAQIADLIDYNWGKWKKVRKMDPNADSGFYKCRIESFERNFSPFKIKIGNAKSGLNIYPNGNFIQFLTKREIEFYESHFENSFIKIENGYEFNVKKTIKPFKEEIERLYAWKESEKDESIKYCVKIILNSLYGKFIQVAGYNNETGKLFNPIYAAEITASARIKILNLALQAPDKVISFSTDSVCATTELKVPDNPKIGEFQADFSGEGVFIMSDVYNLWNLKKGKVKTKLRGFSVAKTKDMDSEEIYLKDILSKMNETTYTYTTRRPYHLGECLIHRKTRKIEDLNVFDYIEKTIDINGDNKRVWSKDFMSGKRCMEENHDSLPILYKENN